MKIHVQQNEAGLLVCQTLYQKYKQQNKVDKSDIVKNLKTLCIRKHYQESEKITYGMKRIFPNFICDQGLVSRIHKELYNLIY